MKKLFGIFVLGLVVNVVGCGDDDNPVKSSIASSSTSSDNFAETILGLWYEEGEPIWTFNADGTLVFDGYEELNYYWSIEGSTLTITDADGNVFGVYEINSLTSEQFVYAEADYPDVKNTQTR